MSRLEIEEKAAAGLVTDTKGSLKNDSMAGALHGTRPLSRAGLARMWTVYRLKDGKPNSGDCGADWRMRRQNGIRVIEHNGASWSALGGIVPSRRSAQKVLE